MACSALSVSAQIRVIGTVKDAAGIPVLGATIVQKGTAHGVAVDMNGDFTLTLNDEGENVIIVSMLGYVEQQLAVSKSTKPLQITLQEDHIGLEEVVVVGFGTQKKVSVTGAIATVGNEDLKSTPTSSVTNALTGRIPGLVTRQTSGRPGADDATMFVRGRASFNSTSPLVLVDGVERDMTQIDPDDISSISVLKDASATAVYGVRGANGVILITTKRGAEGKTKINFSAEFGITQHNRITQTLHAEDVARYGREGVINVGLDPYSTANTRNYGVSEYDLYLYRTQKSPFTHPDNNFVDIFTKNGFQQKYAVNASGGTKRVNYFVSLSYYSQTGMFQTDVEKLREHPTLARLIKESPAVDAALHNPDYNADYYYRRITARSNVDIKLTDDFKVAIDLSYRFGKRNRPGCYDDLDNTSEGMRLFGMFYRNSPQSFPLMNKNGSASAITQMWRQNPLTTLCYTGFRSDYINKMETNFSARYDLHKLVKGLSIDGRFSYDMDWSSWWGMIERPYVYSYNSLNDTYTEGLKGVLPKKQSGRAAATYKKYGEIALRYKGTFGEKHNLSAVGLVTYTSKSVPSSGNKYSYVPHVYKAAIGRVNYDFDNRYLFEVNLGYNGSNRFAKGHRYQLFPAASVGWVLTNEPYFKENKVLSFLKLRGSYGEVGNDNLGSFNYYYLSTYNNGQSYGFGSTWQGTSTGKVEGTMANENIKWEVAKKTNVGIETKWFDNRLSINADYFHERRTDILCTPGRYSITSGISSLSPTNAGIVTNEGYEIEAAWHGKIGQKFNYFLRGVFAYAHNTIKERSEAAQAYPYMYQTGNPIAQFIGYKFDGFFKSYDEIAASPQQFGLANLQPGDIKYKDLNGDGVIDTNDQCPIGFNPVPEVTYSLTAGFSWKGLDVSVMFQGADRASLILTGDLGWDNCFGNYYEEHHGRWTPETASTATYPRFLQSSNGSLQNYYTSDYWLFDSKYLRLKNVQVGYTFPKRWFKGSGISSVRIYANGYNLFTWDNIKKVDPESSNNTNGYFYPQQKIYNFGVNVTF